MKVYQVTEIDHESIKTHERQTAQDAEERFSQVVADMIELGFVIRVIQVILDHPEHGVALVDMNRIDTSVDEQQV